MFLPDNTACFKSAIVLLNKSASAIILSTLKSLTPIFFMPSEKAFVDSFEKPLNTIFLLITESGVVNINSDIILDKVAGSTACDAFLVSLDIIFKLSSIFLLKSSATSLTAAFVPSNF